MTRLAILATLVALHALAWGIGRYLRRRRGALARGARADHAR